MATTARYWMVAQQAGTSIFAIDGASNVTINGLYIRHFRYFGVGVHGGRGDTGAFFPNTTDNVVGTTIINNIFNYGYPDTIPGAGANGAILQDMQVTNSTYANNAIMNQFGCGISAIPYISGPPYPTSTMNGLVIENNVLLNNGLYYGDTGSIYSVDRQSLSTNLTIRNNFIRDYQGNTSGSLTRTVGIYLDEASQNWTITGNVIANTANAVVSSSTVQGTMALFLSSARNITFTGNIIDLGTTAQIVDAGVQVYSTAYPAMTGNTITGNIYIGNWSGAQQSYGIGQGPYAYPAGGPAMPNAPTIAHNLYYNYGSGSLSHSGKGFSDTAPVTGIDPMISGTTYTLNSSSPVYDSSLNFTPIVGGWGPPGYVIPSGTAPSYTGAQWRRPSKDHGGALLSPRAMGPGGTQGTA